MNRYAAISVFIFVFVLSAFMTADAFAQRPDDVPRITAQELKSKLDRGENVVIIDVRSRGSYEASRVKIKGAIRIPPDEIAKRAAELPMGREIDLY
ncbi:MAG: hypothetical protein HYS21_00940 [Deltaproteobacteria bacterium]|nr:hypothetical protein [Deltaproteobacteria bacterium]